MKTLRERLYSRLVPDPVTGCLLWTGCLNSRGYGCIGVGGKSQLVHRVAWELEHGPIPESLTIDHVYDRGCRHKRCANVAHLEPVTRAQNCRRSLPHRVYVPRPARRREYDPGEEFWRHFREWAGPEEWAELTPADRGRIEQAEIDAFIERHRTEATA